MTAFRTFEDDVPDRGWEDVRVVRNVHTGELAVVINSLTVDDVIARDADIDAAEAKREQAPTAPTNTPLRTETPAPARRGRPPGRRP